MTGVLIPAQLIEIITIHTLWWFNCSLLIDYDVRQSFLQMENMDKPVILVTNDDGIFSPGIDALAQELNNLGDVWVFAPDTEQSAVGHGISLNRPLRTREIRPQWHSIDGTPADCVLLAVRQLMPIKPSIVLSGINNGPNLGDDVTYSGTVAGAYEGMLLGLPSLAISNASYDATEFDVIAKVATKIAGQVLEGELPEDTVLNVNVPQLAYEKLNGIAITRQGIRNYGDEIYEREDPRGKKYYWIGGFREEHLVHEGTDFEAIEENKVSVTPLHRNITNFESMALLKDWNLGL
jgi:5'-nucleotidase